MIRAVSKEKPEYKEAIRTVERIVELEEKIRDLEFHNFKLKRLKREYESQGKEWDARVAEFFAEEHEKEVDQLQKKLKWEHTKLSTLMDRDRREDLVEWKNKVELIKSTLSIDEVTGQYVSLKKSGHRFTGRCPFHDDRRPSFVVYPETSSFYCFGCQKGGDIFRFLMEIEKLRFKEAVEVLSRYSGL